MKSIWTPLKVFQYLQKNCYPLPKEALCTKNFLWAELLVNQNELPSLMVLKNLLKSASILQKYRIALFDNSPIIITSGWRSLTYNKKIGGAPKSFHIYGLALDFVVIGFTPRQVQSVLDSVHIGGLEFASGWTHIDLRNYKIRFDNKGNVIKNS